MRNALKIFLMTGSCLILASCAPKREAQVHFQQGFEQPSPTNALLTRLTYNGREIYSGTPLASPTTGHPHVVAFRLGREDGGTLQIEILNVVTQSFTVAWSRGLALGIQFTNGAVACSQPAVIHYSLE
jgi:hypothetical protein